jgi:hypothetical protein
VYGGGEDYISVRRAGGDMTIEIAGTSIYRAAYRTDNPDILLISGQWRHNDSVFDIDYDLNTGRQRLMTCDGKPAYKCTVFGDTVLYADRVGPGFEDRRIAMAASVNYQPVNYATEHR